MLPVKKQEMEIKSNIVVSSSYPEKVVRTEVLANQRLIYRLIESEYEIEDSKAVCYGIEIESSLFGEIEKSKVVDITTDLNFASDIFDLLYENLVTPISLKDILEDFVTQKYSYN